MRPTRPARSAAGLLVQDTAWPGSLLAASFGRAAETLPVVRSIFNPAGAACKGCSPAETPIYLDEVAQRVTVQAGVPTRMLLDYLAAYTCVLRLAALLGVARACPALLLTN